MPPRKRPSSVLNGEVDDLPREADRVTSADDALAAAEEADAEAAEAEAAAAAARARARAIRLRREASAAAAAEAATAKAKEAKEADERSRAEHEVESTAVEESATPEIDQSSASTTEATTPVTLTKSHVAEPPEADDLADEDALTDEDYDEADLDSVAEQPTPAVWKVIAKALVVTVALVGSIALLGLSGAMYMHHRNVEAQRAQSGEFAAAARQGVVTLMSLDFNKAKDDVQRIIDNTTGDFKKDFQGHADQFIKVAQASKVITEANVNAVAVQSMGKDEATVLVAVTTNVSNAASKQQQPRSWRLRVGVAREGDQIKLAKVEFVP
jgi:Mce-associated membrane protein